LLANKNGNGFLKNLTNDQIKDYAYSRGTFQIGAWELAKGGALSNSGLALSDLKSADVSKQFEVLGKYFVGKDSTAAPIISAASQRNWQQVSKLYNGSNYTQNKYDLYLSGYAKLYRQWSSRN